MLISLKVGTPKPRLTGNGVSPSHLPPFKGSVRPLLIYLKFKNCSAIIHQMDSKRLDLNLLVTLETLLVEQNVTKAAARLNLSQPAVSAQLNRLRDLFDDPLFIPAQRGVTPTAKALELLDPLRTSLDGVRETVVRHRHFEPGRAELTISVACTDYLQAAIAIPLAKEVRLRAPGVRIALHNLDVNQLAEQMEQGIVDLALMTPLSAPQSLRSRHLFEERYVLIGRRNHPALRERMSIDDFTNQEHVIVSLRGGDFDTPVDQALAVLGKARRVVLSAASFLFVPEIIVNSDFVALVPERLVLNRADKLAIVNCPFPVEGFEVGMVWHERVHNHSGHRWVRDLINSLVGENAGVPPNKV